jgi:hypothetical protein
MALKKMNKTIAGYHILMILSAVDYRFHVNEDLVIRDWLANEFPAKVNLDKEMEIISGLSHSQWDEHFLECVDAYYIDANHQERLDLIDFAKNLVLADELLYKAEHIFFNTLLDVWKERGIIDENLDARQYLKMGREQKN